MGNEEDKYGYSKGAGFPTYELLLLGIGFIAGILVCTVMAER
jgi:hypothetical protein